VVRDGYFRDQFSHRDGRYFDGTVRGGAPDFDGGTMCA
jgi:hypothetical protein